MQMCYEQLHRIFPPVYFRVGRTNSWYTFVITLMYLYKGPIFTERFNNYTCMQNE